jgi:3-dehydroquinate synthase II
MDHQTEAEKAYIEVIEIKEIGEGMRVCIDFVDILDQQDGLYIGNTGHGYLKILSENRHSENYPPRPFRINCGSFHQYLYQKEKTHYLHEITPGEQILVTGGHRERSLPVGRVKIEKRPLVRVTCKTEENMISATLQKSSSVYVMEEARGEISLLDLNIGDRLEWIQDTPGRHLGEVIDEVIIEK